jgi:outer membrane receptor protein involved in Fe transport
MKHNRNPLASAIRFGLGASVLASLAMTAAPVVAQDEEEETETLDRVQVTGSRIISPIVTSSAPVTEIGEEEIQFTGTTRIEDLVGQYPQAAAVSDAFINNGSSGFPSVSLRGMGTARTLTLVNGRRLPPGGIRSEARDLNTIPAALVKNVEILTGGASAVYGSDAMAGVVNFILDNDFTGFSIQAGYSGFQHDNDNKYMQGLQEARGFEFPTGSSGLDGESKFIDVSAGGFFAEGRGHAMGWLTFRDNDELRQGERDYSSCALNQGGTICGGSSTAPNPNFFLIDSTFDFVGFANRNDDGSWSPGVGELYNYAPINHFQRPDKRWTFGSQISYEINDHFRPYIETMFANVNSTVQIAQSGTFFVNTLFLDCAADANLIGTMCADLGLSTDGPVIAYVGKRNVEGGPRIADIEASNFRMVVGTEGDINSNWSYDVSFLQARNSSSESNQNDFIPSRLAEALLLCPPGSSSGCVPYDVWTNNITAADAAAQGGTGMRTGRNQLQVVNAYVTGDTGFSLPSADGLSIAMVAGYEWRREEFQRISDANMEAGNFAGLGGPRPGVSGEIKVNELFFEAGVPLLADMGFIDNLALDLGYRYSDYSTSGTAHTYKIGFASQIMNNYRVRGGFNRAIRAPNTNELFAQQQIALWSGNDPCSGANPEFTFEQCARTGVTAAQFGSIQASPAGQYNQFVGGNPNLDPEEADTWTIGVVATPIDGLQLALDYWQIEMTDRIGTIGAQTILNFCGLTGDPFLCDKVRRNPATGDLWLGSDPNASGLIESVNDNFGDLTFRGIDLNASYAWEMLGGMFSASLAGAYFLEQEVASLPGVNDEATFDCAGRINVSCQTPNWRHVANFRYGRGDWSASARWRMIGRMIYRETDESLASTDQILVTNDNRIGSYHYFDLSGSYRFMDNYEVTLGVNNIFDKEPPLVGSTLSANANTLSGYDPLGRYLFATIGANF